MLKKINAMMLLLTLVLTTIGVHTISAQTDTETATIRAKVVDYGTGQKVTVKLRDKTEFKGHISDIGSDSFTVTDRKTGSDRTFSYAEVRQVSKSSMAKWIIIGVAAAVAVAILIPLSQRCRNEGAGPLCL